MDGVPSSLELGLLAGACALILIPVIQQLFTELMRWMNRKRRDDSDVWGG